VQACDVAISSYSVASLNNEQQNSFQEIATALPTHQPVSKASQ